MKGQDKRARARWRGFEDGRAYARSLRLKNWAEWISWAGSGARPIDIPSNPRVVYKGDGWISVGDWLGTRRIHDKNRAFRPFSEARSLVRNLGLKSYKDWHSWCKSERRPYDIPSDPRRIYEGKGWTNYSDWLGLSKYAGRIRIYRPFEEARAFVRSLGLKGVEGWRAWAKSSERPEDIPYNPNIVFKNRGWASFEDWLDSTRVFWKRTWRSFEEGRDYVRTLGLKSYKDWRKWSSSGQRPKDIPSTPWVVYRGIGWKGMRDWLHR